MSFVRFINGASGILASVVILGIAVPALADVGLPLPPTEHDRIRGIRFGEFVFVPTAALEGGWTDNVFREDERESPSSAGFLTVRPGWRIANPEPSRVRLTWDASLDVRFWFADDPNVKNLGRYAAKSDFLAEFLPRSVVGFFVADRFIREIQPPNYSSSATYDRNFNHAEAGLQVRPGGGALQFDLSYAYNFDIYDEYKDGDHFYHEVRFLTKWDFFPKTTFLIDVDWRYATWRNPKDGYRADSMPLRALAGVRGYITKNLAVLVKAGYGQGFFADGPDVQTFVGEASVGFKPTPFTVLDVGYARDFAESYYARWYTTDTVHLTVKQQLFRRLELAGGLRYAYVSYADLVPALADTTGYATLTASQTSRRDHVLGVDAKASLSILRYLSVSLGYRFDGSFTDFRLDGVTTAGARVVDYGGYKVHRVLGEVSLYY